MQPVTFCAATHGYTAGGRAFPSVTGVLRQAGYLDDVAWFGSPEALARGKLVHALTRAIDVLGWADLTVPQPLPLVGLAVPRALITAGVGGRLLVACPDPLLGYGRAWQAVRGLYGPRWAQAETPAVSVAGGFAGTPDRIGVFNGQPAVVELKTGEEAGWHAFQTAAYDLLVPLPLRRTRVAVYLRADGTFRVRTHRDPEDYACFVRALKGATS